MATWNPDQKRQYLTSHGYNDEEANSLMGGGNPMQKQAPVSYTPQPVVKAGAGMAQKGLSVSPDALEALRGEGKTDDYIADQMASASPHLASQLKKIRTKFGGDAAATTAFLNTRFYGDTAYSPQSAPEKKGYIGRTLDRIYSAGIGVRENLDAYNQGGITSGQSVLRGGQKIFSGILSPALELSSSAVGYGLEKTGLDKAIGGVAQDVMQSDVGRSVAPYVKGAMDSYNNLPQDSGFRDLAAMGKAGVDALDVYGTGQALGLGKRAITQGVAHPWQSVRHPIQSAQKVLGGTTPAATQELQPDEIRRLTGTAKKAVDKGMDEKFMTFVADQNPDTRAVMAKMTSAAKEGGDVLGGTVQHKEILGGQMMDNLAYILDEKKNVGNALGAMKNAVADDVVNLSDSFDDFMGQLRNKGAVINDEGKIISLAGAADDNIPVLQKTLDFLQPDDIGNVARSGKEIDMWRSKMFEEMNSAKAKLQPSTAGQSTLGFAEKLTNDMRRTALTKLAKGNKNMIALNDAYEELSTNASKFLKSIQYKGKLNVDAITAKELRAGEVALRTLGNASADSRDAFMSVIETARKYGRISNVDEMALVKYADALEDVFPITPTRSLQGAMSRGTKDALGNFTEDVIQQGPRAGVTRAAMDGLIGKINSMRGITPENRFKLLMEVLDAPPETQFFTIAKKVLPDDLAKTIAPKNITAGDLAPSAEDALTQSNPATSGQPLQGPQGPRKLPVLQQSKTLAPNVRDTLPPVNIDDVPLSQIESTDSLEPMRAKNLTPSQVKIEAHTADPIITNIRSMLDKGEISLDTVVDAQGNTVQSLLSNYEQSTSALDQLAKVAKKATENRPSGSVIKGDNKKATGTRGTKLEPRKVVKPKTK